jgi:hypothetical protein
MRILATFLFQQKAFILNELFISYCFFGSAEIIAQKIVMLPANYAILHKFSNGRMLIFFQKQQPFVNIGLFTLFRKNLSLLSCVAISVF